MIDEERVQRVIRYVADENRVCPAIRYWHKLAMGVDARIKAKFRDNAEKRELVLKGWWEVKPLIHSGWEAPDWEKAERLVKQIKFVSEYDFLFDFTEAHLLGLMPEQWHYKGH